MPCQGRSKSRHSRLALLPHSSCAVHSGRSIWRSNHTAPFQGQRMNRPSPPASTTVRAHPRAHHATSPPPRSPRRAATPLALEHAPQRCAQPPPRDASIGRPRVTHSRVNLVQDRRPHEVRDADAATAAPTPCHIQAGRSPRSTRRGCRHRRAHSIQVQAGRSHGTAGSPSFRTPAAPHTVVAHA